MHVVLFLRLLRLCVLSVHLGSGVEWLVHLVRLPECMLSPDLWFTGCKLVTEFSSLSHVSSGFLFLLRYTGMDLVVSVFDATAASTWSSA